MTIQALRVTFEGLRMLAKAPPSHLQRTEPTFAKPKRSRISGLGDQRGNAHDSKACQSHLKVVFVGSTAIDHSLGPSPKDVGFWRLVAEAHRQVRTNAASKRWRLE
jgi:hypothetical protein